MKEEKIITYICNWLSDYNRSAGTKGFVIGVSGGVDSALTSTLCAKTGADVIALNMPLLQNQDQYRLASEHIDWLEKNFSNVRSYETDLSTAFHAFRDSLPEEVRDAHSMANTRSRLRMVTLYAFSTHFRMLVAGTGNKVEDFGIGFFTKYGDGGVDLSPIADLMKTQVRTLAAHLGVNQEILDAAPIDGLWEDDRTDEKQIGATYAELEAAMLHIESGKEDQKLSTREKEVLEIYKRFHRLNEHKMKAIPVCLIPSDLKD